MLNIQFKSIPKLACRCRTIDKVLIHPANLYYYAVNCCNAGRSWRRRRKLSGWPIQGHVVCNKRKPSHWVTIQDGSTRVRTSSSESLYIQRISSSQVRSHPENDNSYNRNSADLVEPMMLSRRCPGWVSLTSHWLPSSSTSAADDRRCLNHDRMQRFTHTYTRPI